MFKRVALTLMFVAVVVTANVATPNAAAAWRDEYATYYYDVPRPYYDYWWLHRAEYSRPDYTRAPYYPGYGPPYYPGYGPPYYPGYGPPYYSGDGPPYYGHGFGPPF